ncbi:hypothetical protein GCM10025779_26420 [Arthrobacter cryoconiti]
MLFIASGWVGLDSAGLPDVSLVSNGLIYPGEEWVNRVVMIALIGAGISLCVSPPRLFYSRAAAVDYVQLTAGALLVVCVLILLPFISGFEFVTPEDRCVYLICWPRPFQEFLIGVPAISAGICMIVLGIGLFVIRHGWWV